MHRPGQYDRSLTPTARKRQARAQLLLSAMEVFAREGYAAANVDAVVKHARMSRRTFYEHFKSLEDVLGAVHTGSGRFALRAVEDAVAAVDDPLEQLRTGVRVLLGLVADNPGLARVLFHEIRAAGPRFEGHQARVRAQFGGVLERVLVRLHRAGLVRSAPHPMALLGVVAAVEAVGTELARGQGAGLEDATGAMVHLALGACGGAVEERRPKR